MSRVPQQPKTGAPSFSGSSEPRLIVMTTHMEWAARKTLWRPPTDVLETDDSLIVRMEVAGMQGGEFAISIQPHFLAVRGNRMSAGPRGAYHQMEINTGEFISLVELSASVFTDRVQAEYKDGFLTIVLPKQVAQEMGQE